ncbi:hypothetical protein [Streptomyces sp. CL12-4]|uniref:hypothetical protein n=1 Tax=Streptomyces sp. CL12-4 TaxID=2810306 RepID=UPI0035AB96E9
MAARHLATRNTPYLPLVSRRGGLTPEAAGLLADLRRRGVTAPCARRRLHRPRSRAGDRQAPPPMT